MSSVYLIDPLWIETIPAIRKKRLIRDFVISIVILIICWFIHLYLFLLLLGLVVVNWFIEFRYSSSIVIFKFWDEVILEVREDGLFQYSPALRKGKNPIMLYTPWSKLKLKEVKRNNNQIMKIRLINRELPWGANTIDIEHYKNMVALLQEIEEKLAINDNT